ncbi:MAG TPA: 1,4-dihydroxy-2-naphthoate polyprenyltransferase [Cryomorphaceae bacterium]|nr:1,4-dihydroxy-2-naphthoate polyprenyltransferase [Cryomorphaceae bacterium]
MSKTEAWFRAFRLRTLPLSFSSVILGSLMALYKNSFDGAILVGALLTTLFLQVLSNLANDYGDFVNGVDNHKRTGPERSVQSGIISIKEMKAAIILFSILSFASGIWLLLSAADNVEFGALTAFFVIGLLAIGAAIKYTIGKNPYGYQGFGDVAVFLFFGITGVAGTFYLHTAELSWIDLLPAVSIGALSTGVLNLNNMRDVENDKASGKRSLVVLMGFESARIYHLLLLILAVAAALTYTLINFASGYQFIFLITLPLIFQNAKVVMTTDRSSDLDQELRKLAFTTLLFALTFGIGLVY